MKYTVQELHNKLKKRNLNPSEEDAIGDIFSFMRHLNIAFQNLQTMNKGGAFKTLIKPYPLDIIETQNIYMLPKDFNMISDGIWYGPQKLALSKHQGGDHRMMPRNHYTIRGRELEFSELADLCSVCKKHDTVIIFYYRKFIRVECDGDEVDIPDSMSDQYLDFIFESILASSLKTSNTVALDTVAEILTKDDNPTNTTVPKTGAVEMFRVIRR